MIKVTNESFLATNETFNYYVQKYICVAEEMSDFLQKTIK